MLVRNCYRPDNSVDNFRLSFKSYGVSSSSQGGGAREQRALSFAVAAGFLATRSRQRAAGGHRLLRAACGAPGPAPGQHGTPQGPESLRCTAPLNAPPPCNNISAHRHTRAFHPTHRALTLITINFTDNTLYMLGTEIWRHCFLWTRNLTQVDKHVDQSMQRMCGVSEERAPPARGIIISEQTPVSAAHTLTAIAHKCGCVYK